MKDRTFERIMERSSVAEDQLWVTCPTHGREARDPRSGVCIRCESDQDDDEDLDDDLDDDLDYVPGDPDDRYDQTIMNTNPGEYGEDDPTEGAWLPWGPR